MKINQTVINKVKDASAQLVVVTKYWNAAETELMVNALAAERCVFGYGENRTKSLEEKAALGMTFNFIGRLQSRQLPVILKHCNTLHSLDNLKHAQKINDLVNEGASPSVDVFVQVNTSGDPAKGGIDPLELSTFLQALFAFENINVIGLSSMGWGEFEESQKRQEFKDLLSLREKYLPYGITSAGTSRDYHLALEEGIDVVRVGKGIIM